MNSLAKIAGVSVPRKLTPKSRKKVVDDSIAWIRNNDSLNFDSIDEPKLHGLIFNAGGVGHDKSLKPMGPNHVLDMVQINLIGHIHLLETLMSNNLLEAGETTIVYSGSEAARGISFMGMAPPKLPDTQARYTAILNGSAFQTKKEKF